MSKSEKAKRLTPIPKVMREIYLKSGNICAFPGCHNVMIDEEGNFIGQLCHIEAAEDGGERFNENMNNEERRGFSNLMLMCYEHHIITNDVKKYTTHILKKMKKDHEDKFSGIIDKMQKSVVDYGKTQSFTLSTKCTELSNVQQFGCNDEENIENSKVINQLAEKLINLPIETKKIFAIMIDRSFFNSFEDSLIIPLHEIELAVLKDSTYIKRQIEILSRNGLISDYYMDDENNCPYSKVLKDKESGWDYWKDIKEYCNKTNVHLEEIIVKVNFILLD